MREFRRSVDVVTFEFENIPAATAEAACRSSHRCGPAGSVLHTTQHRLREKTFLQLGGFPVTPFVAVESHGESEAARLTELGAPAVLKTAGWGYDGKGQSRSSAWRRPSTPGERLSADEAVLEAFVDFEREVSVVAARGLDGEIADYGAIDNTPLQPHPRCVGRAGRVARRRRPRGRRDRAPRARSARRGRRAVRRVLSDARWATA